MDKGGKREEVASGRRNIWVRRGSLKQKEHLDEKPVCSSTGNADKERLRRELEQVLRVLSGALGNPQRKGASKLIFPRIPLGMLKVSNEARGDKLQQEERGCRSLL